MKGFRRLAVLGGSTPYTIGLVDGLAASRHVGAEGNLILAGRDLGMLQLMRTYAANSLPSRWRVRIAVTPEEALDGSDVVLHQIRYGGLAARAADERLARRFAATADESLGPAGLVAGIRMAPKLRHLAAMIGRYCPDAVVVNITNPLSLSTALLAVHGVRRCLGTCELPVTTARDIAEVLDVPPQALSWRYIGLNHRGFLYDLRLHDRPCLPAVLERLAGRSIGGITGEEIARFEAVPLKYFALYRGSSDRTPPRVPHLADLRHRISQELRASPTTVPPSLAKRYPSWYRDGVLPALEALASEQPRPVIINRWDGHITSERLTLLSRWEAVPVSSPDPSVDVLGWLGPLIRQEAAALAAVMAPTQGAIAEALTLDPLVPPAAVEPLAIAIGEHVRSDGTPRTESDFT